MDLDNIGLMPRPLVAKGLIHIILSSKNIKYCIYFGPVTSGNQTLIYSYIFSGGLPGRPYSYFTDSISHLLSQFAHLWFIGLPLKHINGEKATLANSFHIAFYVAGFPSSPSTCKMSSFYRPICTLSTGPTK